MDPQGERIARNEAAYREVNEAIRAGRADQAADAPRPFVCECGRLGCNELVELTLGEYEAVRANPRRFLMLPGHEIPELAADQPLRRKPIRISTPPPSASRSSSSSASCAMIANPSPRPGLLRRGRRPPPRSATVKCSQPASSS